MQTATPSPHFENNDVDGPDGPAISLSSNREAPSPPAPSVCDTLIHNSLSSNKTAPIEYESPNIILDWNNLKKLVDENLGPCKVCKSKDCVLAKKMGVCYASTIGIHCNGCEKKKKELYHSTIMSQNKLQQ